MVLDPFTIERFIRAQLLASVGATVQINGIEHSADAVAFCGERIHRLREDFEPVGWPYIGFTGAPTFEDWADAVQLQSGEFIIRAVMREDQMQGGGADIEDFNMAGYRAIYLAFDGAQSSATSSGTVHGSEVLAPYLQLYGEAGRRISEMGVIARITAS